MEHITEKINLINRRICSLHRFEVLARISEDVVCTGNGITLVYVGRAPRPIFTSLDYSYVYYAQKLTKGTDLTVPYSYLVQVQNARSFMKCGIQNRSYTSPRFLDTSNKLQDLVRLPLITKYCLKQSSNIPMCICRAIDTFAVRVLCTFTPRQEARFLQPPTK